MLKYGFVPRKSTQSTLGKALGRSSGAECGAEGVVGRCRGVGCGWAKRECDLDDDEAYLTQVRRAKKEVRHGKRHP